MVVVKNAHVKDATSLTGNGLRDWLIQRVSALVLGCYFIFLFGFILVHPGLDYAVWHNFFSQIEMKIFTFLAMLSLFGHSWVGIWTVLTDYIKFTGLRLALEILVIFTLLICLIWGTAIIWSI